MRIPTTVQTIADDIARSQYPLSSSQQARVDALRSMPIFAETKHLEIWEEVYGQIPAAEPATALDLLLNEVFEFGCYNLYCRFDPAATNRVYTTLFHRLHNAGIECPSVDDFTDF